MPTSSWCSTRIRRGRDRGGKHDLILADVGQDRWEEINVIVNGGNYGWRLREGFDGFDPKSPLRAPTNAVTVGADGKPFVEPVLAYKTLRGRGTESNAFGVTVTGGYVYRGTQTPQLNGVYIFGDYCSGRIWGLARDGAGAWQMRELLASDRSISSFGEDEAGEVYLTDLGDGDVYRITVE